MIDVRLTENEKSMISSVARKAFDRNSLADASTPHRTIKPGSDPFSFATLDGRVQELESYIRDVSRRWTKNLNQVLFAVERLETQNALLQGEMLSIVEHFSQREEADNRYRDELKSAAIAFAEEASVKIDNCIKNLREALGSVVLNDK